MYVHLLSFALFKCLEWNVDVLVGVFQISYRLAMLGNRYEKLRCTEFFVF